MLGRKIIKISISMAGFAMLFACANAAWADSAVVNTKTVAANLSAGSISVTSSGGIGIDILPSTGGSLGVGKDNISVLVGDTASWQLYISGRDNDKNNYTSLYRDGDSTSASKFTSIPSLVPTNFTANNQWGYAVPTNTTAGFADLNYYKDASTAGTIVDQGTISQMTWAGINQDYNLANSGMGPTDFAIYYGVYAGAHQITGTYSNGVIYTAFVEGVQGDAATLAPAESLQNGDTVLITIEYVSNEVPITTDQISALIYNNDSASPVAHCGNIVLRDAGNADYTQFTCSIIRDAGVVGGTDYDLAVNLDFGGTLTRTFYGDDMITFGETRTLSDITSMQDLTIDICLNTPTWEDQATTYTLTDNRDNKQYAVRKLKDGMCWMSQNLDLNLVVGTGNVMSTKRGTDIIPFTADNTNISSDTWTVTGSNKAYATQTTIMQSPLSFPRSGYYNHQTAALPFSTTLSWGVGWEERKNL